MNVGNGLSLDLGKHQKHVNIRIKEMQEQNFVKRMWNKEDGLWMKENIQSEVASISMGWLNVANKMLDRLPMIEEFCKSIQLAGYNHIVLLGMGGSSLTPLVFQKTFQEKESGSEGLVSNEGIKLMVLDSTDPETIKQIEKEITISNTLFIVSSKSGNTAEVMAFYNYFFDKVYAIKGEMAGENFIAITDEGSPLVELAHNKKFRKVFINFSDIGGRYSALSYFGILPAALMGVNVKELLERTMIMIDACGSHVPASQNPGVILGAAIAELAAQGCDKLTYLLPPSLSSFGLWLEQLLAESTGKNGKGILPINGSPLMEIDTYGKDRLFFLLELADKKNDIQSKTLESFISMEYPSISIKMKDEMDLGQEFFRWEIATATAGAILGVDPFNQPNVQESKKCTDSLLKMIEENGCLPNMQPTIIEDSLQYYYKQQIADGLHASDAYMIHTGALSLMKTFLQLIKAGDYISLQAYLPEVSEVNNHMLDIQQSLQKSLHIAVTKEFGPRYLHSTGQYSKGGPNTGLFIQFICSSSADISVPEQAYTFGLLKKAQAIGDMEALMKNKRRVILIDLGENFIDGLISFKKIIEEIQPDLLNEKTKNYVTPPLFMLNNIEYLPKFGRKMTGL